MNLVVTGRQDYWVVAHYAGRTWWIVAGPYKTKRHAEQVLEGIKTGDA